MESLPEKRTEADAEIVGQAGAGLVKAPPRPPANTPKVFSSFDEGELESRDFEKIPPLRALMEDPEIAGYLKRSGGASILDGNRLARAFAGFAFFAACLFALYCLRDWNLFRHYVPPPPALTPRPLEYSGDIPLQFGDAIRDINAAIRADDKWGAVFEKLRRLAEAMDATAIAAPADVRIWAYTESLVAMASMEVPPGLYIDSYPDEVFDKLAAAEKDKPAPYRAACAYSAILNDLPRGKIPNPARESRLLDVLETVRGEYASRLDDNRDMLIIEATGHIRAFPREYADNDRYLTYHWRRASHAIQRLYALSGREDATARKADRQRWEAVYRYFDFTVLSWEWSKLGRIKRITLDGKDYDRDQVGAVIRALQ